MRTIICVLGMHRSGTSALSRVLNILGCHIPRPRVQARPDNPGGFWEPAELVNIHDAMLRSVGRSYNDESDLPDEWITEGSMPQHVTVLENFVERRLTADVNVVKDPRICRVFEAWKTVRTNARIVCIHMLRHPAESAQSYSTREQCDFSHAVKLWTVYNADAIAATEGMSRCFVTYQELLHNWRSVVARISDELSVVWPNDPEHESEHVSDFLTTTMRHCTDRDLGKCDPHTALNAISLWNCHAKGS